MRINIGIDPGVLGGLAAICDDGDNEFRLTLKFKDATEQDIAQWFAFEIGDTKAYAVIERVSSSPQMGVVSSFTFGRSYGFLRGILTAMKIPFAEVTPQKWQKAMGCMSKGDKNVTKAAAQRLYPQEKITHANADALLLATYCRRHAAELF
jgi:Holliday junction resolvasome RuvABC endonuclease subunit